MEQREWTAEGGVASGAIRATGGKMGSDTVCAKTTVWVVARLEEQ